MAYNRKVRVEWDPAKERANRAKHGIGFDEVRPLFEGDQDYLVIYDEEHSDDEDRFLAIRFLRRGVVVVVHTEPCHPHYQRPHGGTS